MPHRPLRLAVLLAAAVLVAAPPARADDAGRLVGVWRCHGVFDGFQAVVETVLQANGGFTSMLRNQVGFAMRHWGTYQVVEGAIRYRYEGHEPRQFCGPLGCQDLHLPDAETVFFRFIDDDRIETRPSVCMAPPCGCVAQRVR